MSHHLPLSTLDPDELAELRATVRAAASDSGYPAGVRALEGSGTGVDEDLWRLLAEDIGLAGVGLPEEDGGLGGLAEVLAVAEELGATLAPVPFLTSTVLSGQILANCGDAARGHVERIAAGEIAAAAITDRSGVWSPSTMACTTDGATVTGTIRLVPHGASAAFLVVAARSSVDDELCVLVVDAADAVVVPRPALDFSRPVATVELSAAPATVVARGSDAQSALEAGVDVALLAVGADQLGGAQSCFDMTLEYIKTRRQFNREIGSFQAIKHRMADALMLVEMARSGIERVTWSDAESLSADASVVKAWGSDSYNALAAEAIQLHGGIGFTWEHDAHLYFRRARFDAAFLGDAPFHRERVATLLGW
jgi:alkylation response protein AidB-like acyl-CoA dehydrogenase